MIQQLWQQACGLKPWDDCHPRRCKRCGRRIDFGEFVSIFIGHSPTSVVIHDICYQHGGTHEDCLKGVEVDFGDGKSWPAIWVSNLLDEALLWIKWVAMFLWLVLTTLLYIIIHPIRYRRYRQKMREWGIV